MSVMRFTNGERIRAALRLPFDWSANPSPPAPLPPGEGRRISFAVASEAPEFA